MTDVASLKALLARLEAVLVEIERLHAGLPYDVLLVVDEAYIYDPSGEVGDRYVRHLELPLGRGGATLKVKISEGEKNTDHENTQI
jgi:hypothetical protein